MSIETGPVVATVSGGIASIRFNRPASLNAIDAAMAVALRDAVRDVLAVSDTRVIVLSGEGPAFMAGGDLRAFYDDLPNAARTARSIIDPLHDAVAAMAEASVPVIASVHGAVAGAGLSLALGADLTIAAEDARFVPAYSRIGTSQDGGGSWALPRMVGLKRALEIAWLAAPFNAPAALAMGVVNRVVPLAALAAETDGLACRMATGPTQAYGRIKRLLRESLDTPLRQQLDAERESFVACAASADFAEGLAAFFEKRQARFTGC